MADNITETKIEKFSRLLSKVTNIDLQEGLTAVDNIGYILKEDMRKDRRDSWIYDTTFLDSIPQILRDRLAANQAYLDATNQYNGDPNHGDPYEEVNIGTGPDSELDLDDDDFFAKYFATLDQSEIEHFLDTVKHFESTTGSENEEDDDNDTYAYDDVVESDQHCDELYQNCLNEQNLFDVGSFKSLTTGERRALAVRMNRIRKSGKTKATKERNKHRRILDPVKLIKLARAAAKRVLQQKYMPNYDTSSNEAKNRFNELIHGAKMGEFIKTTKAEFKQARERQLSKTI